MNYANMTRVDFIVVHCSATRASADIGAADIDKWHRQRGWLSIGYHYVIRRDGTLEKGRPETAVGSHARGVNQKSIGIVMAGGVNNKNQPENNFTDAQWVTLKALLKDVKSRHPAAKIIGHRDVPGTSKACPSFDVADWLSENPIN